ncbi:hypothetical protein [Intestinibacter sp.]|uniref:hypothetical protein n=1 Tax=Intestinibacter sp. TaxID=1965304 RepID=UPI002A757842|nr:hypothetical protein [Intestinibacter sp.]MDY2734426.1 hypothetical protein [Intestinibacter sp.]
MILSMVDEIVELAKIYMNKYGLNPEEAIDCAVRDMERRLEGNEYVSKNYS